MKNNQSIEGALLLSGSIAGLPLPEGEISRLAFGSGIDEVILGQSFSLA
ncbi:MAG: hypothetical protein ACI9UK_000653 [Candidatus Krumholzibacteriia bacterium]|jgi:hypothetical protein